MTTGNNFVWNESTTVIQTVRVVPTPGCNYLQHNIIII